MEMRQDLAIPVPCSGSGQTGGGRGTAGPVGVTGVLGSSLSQGCPNTFLILQRSSKKS